MKRMHIIASVVPILGIVLQTIGCQSGHEGNSSGDTVVHSTTVSTQPATPASLSAKDSMEETGGYESPFTPYACLLLSTFPDSIGFISGHARAVLDGDDSCVLRLLDTIVGTYNLGHDKLYIRIFDSLCQVSDGYTAEAAVELSGRLFVESTRQYMDYLVDLDRRDAAIRYLMYFFKDRSDGSESYSGENRVLRDTIAKAIATHPPRNVRLLKSVLKEAGFV